MNNVELLMSALEYIETHLKDNIRTADIADACYCSKSTLEKLFQCVNKISVHDYIIRRRMTLAAKALVSDPKINILSVALEYGYSTHESFARAFYSVWNCKPSDIRDRKYAAIYPRLTVFDKDECMEGDKYMSERKHVDISELYDLFKERHDCYFVCCDIKHLMEFNAISRKAGDCAILEALRRLQEVSGPEDVPFRIGADEFCILTSHTDDEYAKSLADSISAMNGKPIIYEGKELPLSLYTIVTKCESPQLKYNDLFTELHLAIRDGKD